MSSNKYADLIINMYSSLQQNIFNIIINALKNSKYQNINKDNIMQWQLEQFAKAGKLTDQVINEVAKVNNETPAVIKEMCQQLGYGTVKAAQSEIKRNTTKAGNLSPDSKGIINSYINQTWRSLYNNVNESLLTRNTALNSAGQIYRDIVTKSTLEVTSGLKTHEQAIRDNVYRWVDRGVPTRLTDNAGRGWSLEGYARTVINTTNHQVINDLRNQTMNVNKVTLAKMSWHSCARPACAPIQGQIVNMVPPEDSEYDSKYDSIYNHGYGKPAGVQGINCGHIFTPWDSEVNIDHKDPDMPTAKQAMKQSEVQQQQRSIERAIRQTKKKMNAAEMLGDKAGMSHFKSVLSNQQARVRELLKDNDFLSRDYSREQIQS